MKKRFRFQWGAFLMLFIFGGLFLLLFGRMLFIQVTGEVEGEVLSSLAEAKYARQSVLTADRGTIVDRNGDLIASDTLSYKLVAVLDDSLSDSKKIRHVDEPEKTAEILEQYIPLEKAEILERLTRSDQQKKDNQKKQVEFGNAGRDINYEVAKKIEDMKLPGILFLEDKKRLYPNGVFASYLVGFASRVDHKDGTVTTEGKMGLEKTFNKELTGIDGKVNFQADKFGWLLPKSEQAITPAQDGYDIQLTIDKTIQNFVEDSMKEVEKEYSPEKMLAIVANPKTGAILAMSQRPAFHPGTREGLTANWLNEAHENTIEPGSTMKMFTLATAIEEKKWEPNAYYKSGQYTLYDRTIRDVNRNGWGTITFLEGFQRSSNVSIAYLRERMGDEAFLKKIREFGFGQKTGINLPNEAAGIILDKNPIERLTTAYGQGSTVTPLQMIQATTAIANEGKMMKPYVIDKITNPSNNKVVEHEGPVEKGQPISKETALEVKEILASTVTSEFGTGKSFALDGYTIAGKTGTAQIPKSNGQYYAGNGNFLYSFIAMAPVEDPELIVYILVQKPKLKAGEYGSAPVAKIFKPVMESSLKYLNIVPNGEEVIEAKTLGEYTNMEAEKAIVELKQQGYKAVIIGSGGKVSVQIPEKGVKLSEGSVVILKTAGETSLPDFTGWSKKTILSFKMLSGLDIRINGEGYVTSQSLSVGTVPAVDEPIVIQLQQPSEIYKPGEEEAEEMIVGG